MFLLEAKLSEPVTPLKLPLQLLVSLRRRELVNFLSGGHPDLVAKKPCCKDDLAMEFIKTLLCSLNSDFALHLDTSAGFPPLPEGGEGQQALAEDTLIILGGASHAERLVNALGLRHSNVADLTLPGWRLTEETAEDLASDISGILRSHDHEKIILVLQVFDNAIFRGLIGDELCDPIKINGKYHVPGKLVIIGQEELKRLFGMATKIICAAKTVQVYVISPLYTVQVRDWPLLQGHQPRLQLLGPRLRRTRWATLSS